jgi:hypothetical protein
VPSELANSTLSVLFAESVNPVIGVRTCVMSLSLLRTSVSDILLALSPYAKLCFIIGVTASAAETIRSSVT